MQIRINRKSDTPLYLQIKSEIHNMIKTGQLLSGDLLPPERKLADSLGVNRTTILNAYRELKADGLIDSHIGKGTIVSYNLSDTTISNLYRNPPIWKQFFSQTAERSKEPMLRELLEVANRKDIISFAAGISSYDTDSIDALKGMEEELLSLPMHYALMHTPTEGIFGLRENIAKMMKNYGINADPHEVMILSGSQQGIDIAARVFLDPGDIVIVEEPSFFSALQIFQSAGARIIGIPIDNNGMRIDMLKHALNRYKPKLIYTMPTFQNPSGTSMSLERRRELISLARQKNVLILEDDPYGQIRFEGNRLPTLKELDKDGYVIYLSTFSKTVFPGARIGWMVADRAVINQFSLIKQMTDLHSNSLSQWLVERFIKSGNWDRHIQKLCTEYKRKRDIMHSSLSECPIDGLEWIKPHGGFYLWCRLPNGVASGKLFYKASEKGIAYVPGNAFYHSVSGEEFIRLNFTYPDSSSIPIGIARLKEAILESIKDLKTLNRTDNEVLPIV